MKKTVLITGAARGIGYAIARAFAAERYNIAILDIIPQDDVAKGMLDLRKEGSKLLYYQGDISDPSQRQNAVDAIREVFGRIDVLVNNAGVAPNVRADLLDATEESWERVMRINLQGPYFLTQKIARWMVEQKGSDQRWSGCIINISSISADTASPSRGEYCVSKAGVSMATKLWAVRLSEYGIPVYEIRPGIIRTDMTAGVKERYDKLIGDGLLLQPRWGEPDDIAKAAVMLARGDIGYSTGQVIMVDGGFSVSRL